MTMRKACIEHGVESSDYPRTLEAALPSCMRVGSSLLRSSGLGLVERSKAWRPSDALVRRCTSDAQVPNFARKRRARRYLANLLIRKLKFR